MNFKVKYIDYLENYNLICITIFNSYWIFYTALATVQKKSRIEYTYWEKLTFLLQAHSQATIKL